MDKDRVRQALAELAERQRKAAARCVKCGGPPLAFVPNVGLICANCSDEPVDRAAQREELVRLIAACEGERKHPQAWYEVPPEVLGAQRFWDRILAVGDPREARRQISAALQEFGDQVWERWLELHPQEG